jgi:phosphohistidine phosphatase
MMVYLLRHGDAEDLGPEGPRTDEERTLTAAGVDKLKSACALYKKAVKDPDRIVSSPLVRAVESAKILAEALHHGREVERSELLVPSARPVRALELLQGELASGTGAVALVGHEPHLGNLLGLLLTCSDRTSMPFKKGMLIGVELDSDLSMPGRLLFCMTQKLAGKLA